MADDISIITDSDVNHLLSALLVPNTGITVTSISFNGASSAAGLYHSGPMGIDDGIILASGDVTNALPPDNSGSTTTDFSLPGCSFCNFIIPGYVSYDAAILEITFDVNPACSTLSFDFIFGSEEYPEWVGSSFNDVFGAYLNGEQIAFDQDGNSITINGPFFSGGYVQLPPGNGLEYDGSTAKLKTIKALIPGSTNNTLVFVICDAGDHILDSGVLLAKLKGSAATIDTTVTGIAPDFDVPPTPECGETLYVNVGDPLTFVIQASDNGPNQDTVVLSATGLPEGAIMSPVLPLGGNPVSSMFSWTPSNLQAGTYNINFKASDIKDGLFEECEFTIIVAQPEINFGCIDAFVFYDDSWAEGVAVNIADEFGNPIGSAYTDNMGHVNFDTLPNGNYSIYIETPLGFIALPGESQNATIDGYPCVEASFELAPTATGKVRDLWWWKSQLTYIRDKKPSLVTMAQINQFCENIFEHFYLRGDGYAIQIENVTYAPGPEPLDYFDLLNFLVYSPDHSNKEGAAKGLLANLLNIAAGYQSQLAIVSADGATASQAITHLTGLWLAGGAPNYLTTLINFRRMHMKQLIPAGIIPLFTPNIMYKPEEKSIIIPSAFSLGQNHPNPFNPSTEINFALPVASEVTLEVYNIAGQKVSTVANGFFEAGEHSVIWNSQSDNGQPLASGVYFYRLKAGAFTDTKKMILMK